MSELKKIKVAAQADQLKQLNPTTLIRQDLAQIAKMYGAQILIDLSEMSYITLSHVLKQACHLPTDQFHTETLEGLKPFVLNVRDLARGNGANQNPDWLTGNPFDFIQSLVKINKLANSETKEDYALRQKETAISSIERSAKKIKALVKLDKTLEQEPKLADQQQQELFDRDTATFADRLSAVLRMSERAEELASNQQPVAPTAPMEPPAPVAPPAGFGQSRVLFLMGGVGTNMVIGGPCDDPSCTNCGNAIERQLEDEASAEEVIQLTPPQSQSGYLPGFRPGFMNRNQRPATGEPAAPDLPPPPLATPQREEEAPNTPDRHEPEHNESPHHDDDGGSCVFM